EERTHDRQLAEHVVEPVERNEGAAHAHLVAMIIDISIDSAADRRAFEQSVADGEAAGRTGELDPQTRELDARRLAAGLLRRGGDALERGFSTHHEVANIERAFLRRELRALRIERHPHLAAGNLRVDVVEAEESAGVVRLEDNDLTGAPAQIADERRIAAELAVQRQARDGTATARGAQIE